MRLAIRHLSALTALALMVACAPEMPEPQDTTTTTTLPETDPCEGTDDSAFTFNTEPMDIDEGEAVNVAWGAYTGVESYWVGLVSDPLGDATGTFVTRVNAGDALEASITVNEVGTFAIMLQPELDGCDSLIGIISPTFEVSELEAPTITSINLGNSLPAGTTDFTVNVTFSEPVIGIGIGNSLSLTGGAQSFTEIASLTGSGAGPYAIEMAGLWGGESYELRFTSAIASGVTGVPLATSSYFFTVEQFDCDFSDGVWSWNVGGHDREIYEITGTNYVHAINTSTAFFSGSLVEDAVNDTASFSPTGYVDLVSGTTYTGSTILQGERRSFFTRTEVAQNWLNGACTSVQLQYEANFSRKIFTKTGTMPAASLTDPFFAANQQLDLTLDYTGGDSLAGAIAQISFGMIDEDGIAEGGGCDTDCSFCDDPTPFLCSDGDQGGFMGTIFDDAEWQELPDQPALGGRVLQTIAVLPDATGGLVTLLVPDSLYASGATALKFELVSIVVYFDSGLDACQGFRTQNPNNFEVTVNQGQTAAVTYSDLPPPVEDIQLGWAGTPWDSTPTVTWTTIADNPVTGFASLYASDTASVPSSSQAIFDPLNTGSFALTSLAQSLNTLPSGGFMEVLMSAAQSSDSSEAVEAICFTKP